MSKHPVSDGENNVVVSAVLFILCFGIFAAGLYALSFMTLSNPWPMAVCLACAFVAFALPQHVLGWLDRGER
ncbi:hypothetical protein KIH31_07750 [Paenarthrobacter sp. DKR-5]|uniref:hypothetical protein n=1 Tax=Paenarthrobacter sp. DKR-5 TaxID=2835535 RepID=UPI001BDCDB70|nr:hypothetical protein [Paenarthrobacter sp. DKR-5]MBT1002495.1 hypothetical protein [Paenarthrobacter sp. DKR-5]